MNILMIDIVQQRTDEDKKRYASRHSLDFEHFLFEITP